MSTTSFDLTGRVALVTGASRGIGRALADGLAGAGATVVLGGRDPDRLADARAALAADRDTAVHTRAFDVTDEEAVTAAVDALTAVHGGIDILVNNAGIQHRRALLDLDLADWDAVLRTDLTSAFVVGRAAARGMVERGHGAIVNVCSVQSELARPSIAPYAAAKGGLRNLTRAMTAEWAAHGVRVNGLAPGYLRTELTAPLAADPDFDAWVRTRTPAGRWGEVGDLVGPAVFLASDAASFVSGQVLYVDGGMTSVV
ncbi:glucose 1-dehydrogenase [Saccharomonospora iraqiensis]|uniref:glucose 1-dehydrogenase n=1 Tax=Saccharomonospora iraqiensis TaxID=52698 RepID=UPI00022DED7D|nr:glucose 1-dehydrogenase [Saccharomonospora iraqiensis]